MDVTSALQNIGHGGGRLDPHPEIPTQLHGADRWELPVDRLKPVKADVQVLNEVSGWPWARLDDAARDLDMAAVGITPSRSDYPTAFMCNRDRIELAHWNTDPANAFHHGAIVAFAVEGRASPLAVAGANRTNSGIVPCTASRQPSRQPMLCTPPDRTETGLELSQLEEDHVLRTLV